MEIFESRYKRSQTQKKIIECKELNENMCITASAGAGKTTVLVQRILYILQHDPRVTFDNMLVITFGEKAAHTLKERLRKELERLAISEKKNERKRYQDLLTGLSNAYIGTIHSFASRILKENPLEVGVEPHFEIVSIGMDTILMERVINALFFQRLSDPSIMDFLSQYYDKDPASALKEIYAKARSHEIDIACLEVPVKDAECVTLINKFKAYLDQCPSTPDDNASPSLRDAHMHMQSIKQDMKDVSTAGDITMKRIDTIAREAKGITKRVKKAPWGEYISEFKDVVLPEFFDCAYEVCTQKYKECFVTLLKEFAVRYEEEKKANHVLDFDDLLWWCAILMKQDTPIKEFVVKSYTDRFSYIFVDEVQDTSPVQLDIIKGISANNALFFVGDKKQSIYRFRNADVQSFDKMVSDYVDKKQGAYIPLDENYRSRKSLVAFNDYMFGDILGDDYTPVDAKASYPENVRNEYDVEIIQVVNETSTGEKDTEHNGDTTEQDDSTAREKEARCIASRIKEIITRREVLVKENVSSEKYIMRPAQYKDIALLFPSLREVFFYENALKQAHIPYYVIKGGKFFDCQEVRDCLNYLKILDDPYRDCEFAAVLKSPMVHVTDDALFTIRNHDRQHYRDKTAHPFYESLNTVIDAHTDILNDTERRYLKRFMGMFNEMVRIKDIMPIPELLEKVVFDTGYDIKVMALADGKKRYANILKLIEKAWEFEKKGCFTLGEFITYIEKLSSEEVQEPEAQIELEEGKNSVKLCTIHRAKGMEFPVVVCADMGRQFPVTGRDFISCMVVDGVCEVGIKARNSQGETRNTLTTRHHKTVDDSEESAERKRVFYVALTRARDYLILSGVNGRVKDEKVAALSYDGLGSYMNWIRKKSLLLKGEDKENNNGFSIKYTYDHDRVAVPHDSTSECISGVDNVDTKIYEDGEATKEQIAQIAIKEKKRILDEIKIISQRQHYPEMDFSVTPLCEYRKNSEDYFSSYELMKQSHVYEDKESEEAPVLEYDDERIARNEFGELFHLAMRIFNFNAQDVLEETKRVCSLLKEDIPERDIKELYELVYVFTQTDLFTVIAKSAQRRRVYREVPFVYIMDGTSMRGVIDLIYYEEGKGWVILDYKTNNITHDQIDEKVDFYSFQLLLYANAFRSIMKSVPQALIIYFAVLKESRSVPVTNDIINAIEKEYVGYKAKITEGDFSISAAK
ncbi:MAG: UvrD-helicase domain-containing protein [Candidatus Ancaeobacter aquaticus]|nr:UvrD-helicase domain-containing protein [Candidatus Ancaeobacter aquaticus]